jgi:beta-lactamase regulating signal transducer with metallopeptidase domain
VASCIVLGLLAIAPVVTMRFVYPAVSVNEIAVAPTGNTGTLAPPSRPLNVIANPSVDALNGWILPLWMAGVFLFSLRLVWAGSHASSLRHHGVKADPSIQSMIADLASRLGIRRRLEILVCSLTEVPSIVGWIRPVILVPASVLVGLTPQQLEALLAHELAHIRRHDYIVNILQMVVETLFFYHPAVWWISGRIRHERELCCDDIAVGACGNAVAYARALAQLEKLRPTAPILAMGSAGGGLYWRVQRLLGVRGEDVPSRLACAVGLIAGVLCLGWVLETANAEQQSPQPFSVQEGRAPMEPLPAFPIPPRPPVPAVTPLREAPPAPLALIPPELPPVPPAPASPISIAPLPPTLSVPAPAAPALPVPAAPMSPVAPPAAPLPVLPTTAAPLAIPPLQSSPLPWVLFRGNDVIVRGSAADEEQARRARASYTGDLLWFQLDGRAYTTQDRETLDQIQALAATTSTERAAIDRTRNELLRQTFEELFSVSATSTANMPRALVDLRARMAELQAATARLQAAMAQREAAAANLPQGLVDPRSQAELEVATARLHAAMAQRESEIQKMQAEVALQEKLRRLESDALQLQRVLDTLRGAVGTGKAQPTP